MTKFYAQEKRVFDIDKVTVVGSPTITSDGVATNLNQNNHFAVPFIDFKNKSFLYKARVKFDDLTIDRNAIFGQKSATNTDYKLPSLICEYKKFRLYTPKNGTSWDTYTINDFEVQVNTWYDIELIIDLTNVILKVNNKIILTKEFNGITYDIGTNAVCLGTTLNIVTWKLNGSIDLTAFKIYVDGELVYSPTKPICYLERRKEGFDLSKFTVVGSPTITEAGVASGFSSSNYISTINIDFSKPWVVKGRFNIDSSVYGAEDAPCLFALFGENDYLNQFVALVKENYYFLLWNITTEAGATSKTADITVNQNQFLYNTDYDMLIGWDGNDYYIKYKLSNSQEYIKIPSFYSSTDYIKPSSKANANNKLVLGVVYYDHPLIGSTDLTQFSITVDGKEVFTGAKEKFYAMQGGI